MSWTQNVHKLISNIYDYRVYSCGSKNPSTGILGQFQAAIKEQIDELTLWLDSIILDFSTIQEVDAEDFLPVPSMVADFAAEFSDNKEGYSSLSKLSQEERQAQINTIIHRNFGLDETTLTEAEKLRSLDQLNPDLLRLSSRILSGLYFKTFLDYAGSHSKTNDDFIAPPMPVGFFNHFSRKLIRPAKDYIVASMFAEMRAHDSDDDKDQWDLSILTNFDDIDLSADNLNLLFDKIEKYTYSYYEEAELAGNPLYLTLYALSKAKELDLDVRHLDILGNILENDDLNPGLERIILLILSKNKFSVETSCQKDLVNYMVDKLADEDQGTALHAAMVLSKFESLDNEHIEQLLDMRFDDFGLRNTLLFATLVNSFSQEGQEQICSEAYARLEESDFNPLYLSLISHLDKKPERLVSLAKQYLEQSKYDDSKTAQAHFVLLHLYALLEKRGLELLDSDPALRDEAAYIALSAETVLHNEVEENFNPIYNYLSSIGPAAVEPFVNFLAKDKINDDMNLLYVESALMPYGDRAIDTLIKKARTIDPNKNSDFYLRTLHVIRNAFLPFQDQYRICLEDVHNGAYDKNFFEFVSSRKLLGKHHQARDKQESFAKLFDFLVDLYKKTDDSEESQKIRSYIEFVMHDISAPYTDFLLDKFRTADTKTKALLDSCFKNLRLLPLS